MISFSNTPIQADSEANYNELWDDTSRECISLNSFQRMPMRDPSSEDRNDGAEPKEGMAEDLINVPECFDLVHIFTRY